MTNYEKECDLPNPNQPFKPHKSQAVLETIEELPRHKSVIQPSGAKRMNRVSSMKKLRAHPESARWSSRGSTRQNADILKFMVHKGEGRRGLSKCQSSKGIRGSSNFLQESPYSERPHNFNQTPLISQSEWNQES